MKWNTVTEADLAAMKIAQLRVAKIQAHVGGAK
jgi:hypothetical protein